MPTTSHRRWARALSYVFAALCVLWLTEPAYACGVSGPDGVWSCSLEEHEEQQRPRWRVGVSGLYSRTALRFGDGLRAQQWRTASLATLVYAPTAALSLQASAGALLSGELQVPDGSHRFDPGPTGALGINYRLRAANPFVLLNAVVSFSTARTYPQSAPELRTRYSAFDLRLGAAVGYSLWDALRLYAVVRVFGGPIFWRYQGTARTGTDAYHFQLGAGLSWLITERVNLFLEGVPLGERALSGGAALSF